MAQPRKRKQKRLLIVFLPHNKYLPDALRKISILLNHNIGSIRVIQNYYDDYIRKLNFHGIKKENIYILNSNFSFCTTKKEKEIEKEFITIVRHIIKYKHLPPLYDYRDDDDDEDISNFPNFTGSPNIFTKYNCMVVEISSTIEN